MKNQNSNNVTFVSTILSLFCRVKCSLYSSAMTDRKK